MDEVESVNNIIDDISKRLFDTMPVSNKSLSLQDKDFVRKYYRRITGKQFKETKCGSCYSDYFLEIKTIFKNNQSFVMKKSKFIIQRGRLLQTPGVNSILSFMSDIEDIDAIEHLAKFPEKINLFEEYPNNWRDMVKQYQSTGTLSKNTESEVNTEYDDKFMLYVIESLKNGDTQQSIEDKYYGELVNGKKLTKKKIREYISEANTKL